MQNRGARLGSDTVKPFRETAFVHKIPRQTLDLTVKQCACHADQCQRGIGGNLCPTAWTVWTFLTKLSKASTGSIDPRPECGKVFTPSGDQPLWARIILPPEP